MIYRLIGKAVCIIRSKNKNRNNNWRIYVFVQKALKRIYSNNLFLGCSPRFFAPMFEEKVAEEQKHD